MDNPNPGSFRSVELRIYSSRCGGSTGCRRRKVAFEVLSVVLFRLTYRSCLRRKVAFEAARSQGSARGAGPLGAWPTQVLSLIGRIGKEVESY